MNYEKANKYNEYKDLFMGPNPLKLEEELLSEHHVPAAATVMDLGCGRGITSVFLVKEYGFRVFAADFWGDPSDNKRFFDEVGLSSEQIIPIYCDANKLPFAHDFFDAVVCIDSYHYFGMDPDFLGTKLLPWLKPGGYIYIAIPGMKKDCHDNLPAEMLKSWTAEDLDTIHDAEYWRNIISQTKDAEIVSISEMEGNEECWNDWLSCDNEYAVNDRKAMEAGGGKYMNFIKMVIRRK